jgi:hypothetical protein
MVELSDHAVVMHSDAVVLIRVGHNEGFRLSEKSGKIEIES